MSLTELLRGLPADLRIEISENEFRKEFTESEKAAVQAILRVYMEKNPGKGDGGTRKHGTDEAIGEVLGESHENVRRRDKVFKHADKQMKKDLDTGKRSLRSAYVEVTNAGKKEAPPSPLPPGKFTHIVEDPRWEDAAPDGKKPRTVQAARIAAINVRESAADSAVLYLWTTNRRLITGSMMMSDYLRIMGCGKFPTGSLRVQSDALAVMACHGFNARHIVTWEQEKKEAADGDGLNDVTEHLIIGTRGDVPSLDLTEKSIIKSKYEPGQGAYSRKPEESWKLIEKCIIGTGLVDGVKHRLAMNQCINRRGWTVYGDELKSK